MHTSQRVATTAVVVGRFQPFHLGHRYLLEYALQGADKVVVAIGSSNVHNLDNPYSYTDRAAMVQQVIAHEGWSDRVEKVVPLPDYPDDQEWVRQLELRVGAFEHVVGNNDWTNRVLAAAGYGVVTLPDLDRERYQGTHIRAAMRAGEPWHDRVPVYLVEFLEALHQ